MTYDEAKTLIAQRFTGAQFAEGTPLVVTVQMDEWVKLAQLVKNELGCHAFSFLTAVDWKEQGLEVIARLDNLQGRLSVTMKTRLGAGVTSCPSLAPLYRGANWMERECYDMFGIHFEGHPDLRRILLGDDWVGHPLLKSYAVDTPHPPYR